MLYFLGKFSLKICHNFVRDAVRVITHSWSQYWCYMLKLQLPAIWRMQSNQWAHLQLYHRNPDTLRRARHIAKLNCLIQPNYGEVGTHATCGTGNLWEIFNNQEQTCSSFQTTMIHASFESKDISLQNAISSKKGEKDLITYIEVKKNSLFFSIS